MSLRDRGALASLTVLYVASFHLVYRVFVVPDYGYLGYTYLHPPLELLLLAGALAVLPSLLMPTSTPRISGVVLWIIYLVAYVPSQLVPYYVLSRPARLLPWSLTLAATFFLIAWAVRRPPRSYVELPGSPALLWLLAVPLAVGAYVATAATGVRVVAPDLADAYVNRFSYRSAVASQGVFLAYAVTWVGNVINPLLMSFGLVRRRTVLLACGILGQVVFFSLGGFKTLLLSPFFVIGLHFAYGRDGDLLPGRILCAAVVIVVAAGAVSVLIGGNFLLSDIVRRVIATPGLLSAYYFDFFSQHPTTQFSSVLPGSAPSAYTTTPPFLIGRLYFGNPEMSANANLFASGFSGFGLPGLAVIGGLLALLLRAVDWVGHGRDPRLMLGMWGMAAFTLCNSSFLTALQTHGLGLAVVITLLLPLRVVRARSLSHEAPRAVAGVVP